MTERFTPAMRGQIAYEHIHRYAWCLDLVSRKKVLDVASGDGYGSALLAGKAKSVVGVDVSGDTVIRASQTYGGIQNLTFVEANVTSLPFGEAEFDVVVSFETIEHLAAQDQMLDEIARVLRPDGVLIISTPNRPVYSGPQRPHNPFHIREFDLGEFQTILAARFPNVETFGQRLHLGSLLVPIGETASSLQRNAYQAVTRIPDSAAVAVKNATIEATEPEYLIAICSREALPRLRNPNSLFADPADDLWLEKEKVLRWASKLHDEDEVLRGHVAKLDAELVSLRGDLTAERRRTELLTSQVTGSKQISTLLETELKTLSSVLAASTARNEQLAAIADTFQTVLSTEQAKVAEAEQHLAEQRRVVAEREAEVSALRKLQELSLANEQRLIETANLNEKMRRHLAEREADIIIARRQIEAMTSEMNGLRAALDQRVAHATKQGELTRQLEEELKTKHALATAYEAEIETLKATVDTVTATGKAANDELEAVNAKFAEEMRALADKEAAMASLEADLIALRRQEAYAAATIAELEKERAGHIQARQLLAREVASLKEISDKNAETLRQLSMTTPLHPQSKETSSGHGRDGVAGTEFRPPEAPEKSQGVNGLNGYSKGAPSPLTLTAQNIVKSSSTTLTEPSATSKRVGPVVPPSVDADVAAPWPGGDTPRPWLKPHMKDFWITQALRDHMVRSYGGSSVGSVEQLMGMVSELDRKDIVLETTDSGKDLIARVTAWARAIGETQSPDVSIIVPVYNNLVYTLTSILSVMRQPSRFTYEIIIADDRSTDGTESVISCIGGCVRLVRHAKNGGFLLNCNKAAEKARGRYLVFLNNDTVTLPGWLDQLIGTFEAQANVGLAGSKLLNGDGSLQEAGGIFWKDGSAWNFGRNQDPQLPQFNYVKDVDYISGASIAVPAEIWRKLGGFDRLYMPAYCEDSDIAFRIRAAGLRCVYQPHSEVIHHEGRSHGTDTSTGIKAYQVLNQQKLLARWRHVLEREHFPNGENVFVARDRSRGKPHILFIDHYVPQWDRDAGSRYMYHYLKLFQESGFQVVLWPDNLFEDVRYVRHLQQLGIEVIYSSSYVDRFPQWFSENARWIKYVFSSRPHVTDRYIADIRRRSKATVFYVGHDVHWKRLERQMNTLGEKALVSEIKQTKNLEDRVCRACDVLMYPSEEECGYIREAFPAALGVVELPLLLYTKQEIEEGLRTLPKIQANISGQCLFVGGFNHPPNSDAVKWLSSEVLPRLLARGWKGKIKIVGSNMPDAIKALDGGQLEIVGAVSDEGLDELYRETAVALIPLRYGAGVKGKTIEAFARGVPVVSTLIGMQGVNSPNDLAFVADDGERFADAIMIATTDRKLAMTKAENALDHVRQRYSSATAIGRLAPYISELQSAPSLNCSGHQTL